MHRNFALTVLFFWIVIVILFFREVSTYAMSHNIGLFEALQILDMNIQKKLIGYGIISSIAFVFIYTIRPLVFFPASIMTIGSVFIFGPFEGFAISYVGELSSAIVTYYVGKFFGDELGVRKAHLVKKILPYFQKNAFISVFVLRIIPLFPFDFVNYTSGIFKINFKQYFLATVLGVIPGLAVFIFLTYALTHRDLLPWAIASTVALILSGLWIKKKYEVAV